MALRIATELISSLRYKLRMFGIPIEEPANVFCDNEAVYKNSAFAESRLKRKHQSICFHLVREAVAAEKIIVHKVDSKDNLADLLTKSVPAHRRKYLKSKNHVFGRQRMVSYLRFILSKSHFSSLSVKSIYLQKIVLGRVIEYRGYTTIKDGRN